MKLNSVIRCKSQVNWKKSKMAFKAQFWPLYRILPKVDPNLRYCKIEPQNQIWEPKKIFKKWKNRALCKGGTHYILAILKNQKSRDLKSILRVNQYKLKYNHLKFVKIQKIKNITLSLYKVNLKNIYKN